MGFLVLSFPFLMFLAYVITSIVVTTLAPSGKPRRWVVVIVLLVWFWDLPVAGYHAYLCETEAGFKKYKTLDQWKSENPGEAAKLIAYENPLKTVKGNQRRYQTNQRFSEDLIIENIPISITRIEKRAVDVKSEETLFRFVDFKSQSGDRSLWNIRKYKFWLDRESCWNSDARHDVLEFNGAYAEIAKMGDAKK